MEKEALTLEVLSMAMASKNSGGIVIVQVERINKRDPLNPRLIKIPGILVDCVVVARPENHCQTFATQYDPAFSCEERVPIKSIEPMPLDERKIIARRASLEIKPNSIVNLGIGMPEGVSRVAAEEDILDLMTLTTEPGAIGGIPAGGLNFGASINMDALIDQPYQFDFYDGGGLDLAFLGMAQVDKFGNLNVSKFGQNLAGAGGFINISQNAKKVIFLGTFTAGSNELKIEGGKLKIDKDGALVKFVDQVEHITYSGRRGAMLEQPVLYITERAVFLLSSDGLELIEVAPGIDIKKDILSKMDFEPVVKRKPVMMDKRIFEPQLMGLKDDWVSN
jgi:propionate CoA-transferase